MEKRHQKTLALTLNCSATCARLLLIAILFFPVFLIQMYYPQTANEQASIQLVQKRPQPKPQELVKIYAIVKSHRRDISDTEAWTLAEAVREQSTVHSFDPLLVLAMIQVESGFQYALVSPSGARGIMQILPDVAKAVLQ